MKYIQKQRITNTEVSEQLKHEIQNTDTLLLNNVMETLCPTHAATRLLHCITHITQTDIRSAI
jgi:hypothetical protein